MSTKCFEIDEHNHLVAVKFDGLVERWRAGAGPFWIDVESANHDDWLSVLGAVGLGNEQEVVDELLQSEHAARLFPLDEALFFEFPTRFADDRPELLEASFVCLDRLLITLRGSHAVEAPAASAPIVDVLLRHITLRESSVSALVCALLVELSVGLRRRLSLIREETARLGRRMDAEPESVELQEILGLKRAIIDLDAVTDERAAVMEILEPLQHPFLNLAGLSEQFRVAVGNTVATARRLDRLDRRVQDLQHRHDAHQQDKTNRRLSRLTIISAIFLPLTLIAGIYGMNFDSMPELHHPLGYPLALGGMTLVAIGMIWWFRAKGWMD